MLEMFFDDKKVFSFFEELLKNEDEKVNCFEILFDLDVSPEDGSEILRSFVYLGILSETDELRKGIFKVNYESPVVLGICLFDEFICNVCEEKIIGKGEKEDKDFSFEDFYKSINFDGIINPDEIKDIINGSI